MRSPLSFGDRPRLLVSVRNAGEARLAIQGGAEILDIKEPKRGSLGMADPKVMADILETVRAANPAIPVSAALGELCERQISEDIPQLPTGVKFLKLGLSQSAGDTDWGKNWRELRAQYSEDRQWVAVIYADWQTALAPSPEEILTAADHFSCVAVLVDTFLKDGRSLVEVLSEAKLCKIAHAVRQRGLPLALAGSLRPQDLPLLKPMRPDIIAIRSAACSQADRAGRICETATQHFRDCLAQAIP